MRDIFGQKQTDAFSSILRHVWSGARDMVKNKAGPIKEVSVNGDLL